MKEQLKKFPDLFDLDLDQAVKDLQKAINYGDYLAHQKKISAEDACDKKEALRKEKLIALKSKDICSGSDAKTREEQAMDHAAGQLKSYEQNQIELDYLTDLFRNNHVRIEALRTIISSKKQNVDHYRQNSIS
jgi:hypothetical protein